MRNSAIVIGAGIAGLASARALALRGYQVRVIERSQRAVGASIRNFGMIWPVGQPDGGLYERALLSRAIWKEVCSEAKIWNDEVGSLHTAYRADEWQVLQEIAALYRHRNYSLLSAGETGLRSPYVVQEGLLGTLYSPDELIVDPRQAIRQIPQWLQDKFQVDFTWGRAVRSITYPYVFTGNETLAADRIIVCTGADFETLYPELFAVQPLVKCKLQMMRMAVQPGGARIGPAICGGLSLIHYAGFKAAPSLPVLQKRYESEYPDYLQHGIHVMVAQQEAGELTVGDSHAYGMTHDPFHQQQINRLILEYLHSFARFRDETITETWNGIYAKHHGGATELVLEPEPGVTVINGLGGTGMTLSFGLCEQLAAANSW